MGRNRWLAAVLLAFAVGACGEAPGDGALTLRDRIELALRPDTTNPPSGEPAPDGSAPADPAPGAVPGTGSANTALDSAEREAIRSAARDYVRSNSVIRDFSLDIDAAADSWARARVVPARGETDPAYLYLRKTNGQWRGVVIGTDFTPADLEQLRIPRSVRPRNPES